MLNFIKEQPVTVGLMILAIGISATLWLTGCDTAQMMLPDTVEKPVINLNEKGNCRTVIRSSSMQSPHGDFQIEDPSTRRQVTICEIDLDED